MSEERSVNQIEDDLAKLRSEMTETVDELMDNLNPKTNAKKAVDEAKNRAQELQAQAQQTVRDAMDGNPQAIKIVAIAGGALALAGLLVLRKILK